LSDRKAAGPLVSAPGGHSLAEILSQPQFWGACLEQLRASGFTESVRPSFDGASEWIFIGCGSSYYIALAAAATWSAITGVSARAIPASEILLFPETALPGNEKRVAVLISRSGRTSETVSAAEFLRSKHIVRTLTVTGTQNELLEKFTHNTLPLLPSDEQSTVMTRSFTSMLLGLQSLAASWAGNQAFLDGLDKMAAMSETILKNLHPQIQDFVEAHEFADYVCLGQGPFYGLACETALKVTEMSCSYAQSFHTLEFRHGPKSIVSPETLVIFLLSEQGYDAECEVLQEIKNLGGTTIAIANRADRRAHAASDLLIEFGFTAPELARIAPYVLAGQLLGLHTGLKKGLDPDNPRNLSRVVILNE
jgi:glutamine---fructose-6-phosphate transaminase (isomerizing)